MENRRQNKIGAALGLTASERSEPNSLSYEVAPTRMEPSKPRGLGSDARPSGFGKFVLRYVLIFFVLFSAGLGGILVLNALTGEEGSNNQAARFGAVDIPLSDLPAAGESLDFGTRSLAVNGPLRANDAFILTPQAQPVQAVAGQLYYDQTTNLLNYYNGTQFVKLTAGVASVASGSPSLAVTDDGNFVITAAAVQSGGTVGSSGGTAGRIAKFTGVQTLADALLSEAGSAVTVNGDLSVTGSVSLTNALSVSSGGIGTTSVAVNGVVIGNGTSALTSVTAGGVGLCLVSTAGAPTFAACPGSSGVTSLNGLIGALTIANSTGSGSTITINDATTAAKGIASFSATNFSVAGGAVNTIQNISIGASPTFVGLTLSGDLAVNGGNITGTGNLTLNATGTVIIPDADTLQSNDLTSTGALTLISGGGGNVTINSAATIEFVDNTNITGTLSTTSTFTLGATGTADSATYLCRNTSNQIATCSGTAAGTAFVQGGNDFNATAVLGTNDTDALSLETNNLVQVTIAVGGATTFQNSANSTSALRVLNAAGTTTVLNVDTTNGRVGINTTTPSERLTVNGDFNVRDADVASKQYRFRTSGGALDFEGAGASMHLSVWDNADFTGTQRTKLILTQGSNETHAISTWHFTSAAFAANHHTIDGSSGGNVVFNDNSEATNVTIEGDNDANALFLQGSTDRLGIGTGSPGAKLHVSSAAAEALFRVTDATASAVDVFNIADEGAVTFQSRTNATTAFRVLNASAVPLFVADTSNSRVYIGNPTSDTTGALLVLDTKSDSGDPTGINGSMYYNSSMGRMRCFESSIWHDCTLLPQLTFFYWNDLFSLNGDGTVTVQTSGTGANQLTSTNDTNHPGVAQLPTGSTTTGRSAFASSSANNPSAILFGSNTTHWTYESAVRVPTLSDATDTFSVNAGFIDAVNGDSTDGCYFVYNDTTNSGRWTGRCRSNSSGSDCDTGISVAANTWYKISIVVDTAGTSVDFQTDGVSRCQVTTNIPTAAGRETGLGSAIRKSAGTSLRNFDVDYITATGRFSVTR